MNFLAPLFLLGALAVAGPVIFHLIRRTTRERMPFSSLLLLKPDPPRLTKRSRIDNWLLLLLRAAALGLLALAFARPFVRSMLPEDNREGAKRRLVLLVDRSASMRRGGLKAAAEKAAGEVLESAKPGDQVAVWTFARGTRRLVDFQEWTETAAENRVALARGRLADAKPGWGGTNLSAALTGAAEVLGESAGGAEGVAGGEIFLVSDMQEGSRVEGLQGWEWPKGVTVTVKSLTANPPGNAGLQLAPVMSGLAGAEEEPMARVRVGNARDSAGEQFQVGWAGDGAEAFAGTAQDVYVPPGQSRMVSLAWPEGGTGAGRVRLRGDAEEFDNVIFAVPPETAEVRAFYFGAEAEDEGRGPLFFLKQALPQTRQVRVSLTVIGPEAAAPVLLPGQPSVYFVGGVLPEGQRGFLKEQLTSGHTVLVALTSAEMGETLAGLAGVGSVGMEEVKPDNYVMFSEIDFRHPLFAPFADPRFSDFTKIRFWKYRRFEAAGLPGARVLTHFDSGAPALVEVPVGEGRLVVLAAGWQPEDSQLALSSKFVPLLASLLEWSGAVMTPPAQFGSGAAVDLTLLGFREAGAVTVKLPDGTVRVLEEGALRFAETELPGFYTASAAAAGVTRDFVVNGDPAESRTAPMAADELERLGVPVLGEGGGRKVSEDFRVAAAAVESESRQKLWRWIMAAALAVLLIETLLAGLSARRAMVSGGNAV